MDYRLTFVVEREQLDKRRDLSASCWVKCFEREVPLSYFAGDTTVLGLINSLHVLFCTWKHRVFVISNPVNEK